MRNNKILYSSFASPIGALHLARGSRGITDLHIAGEESLFIKRLELRHGAGSEEDRSSFTDLFRELESYFEGRLKVFRTPVDLAGTPFELLVWKALTEIPWGETATYALLAAKINVPGGARAAGNACGKNPVPIIVPCHRVLRGDGSLGGYTGGVDFKKALLEIEGVSFYQVAKNLKSHSGCSKSSRCKESKNEE